MVLCVVLETMWTYMWSLTGLELAKVWLVGQ